MNSSNPAQLYEENYCDCSDVCSTVPSMDNYAGIVARIRAG
jgi:hypothetical protein